MSKKFTRNQWNAFHSGRGYRLGYEKRMIDFKKPENRASFRDGYRAVGKNLDRYAKIPRKSKKKSS